MAETDCVPDTAAVARPFIRKLLVHAEDKAFEIVVTLSAILIASGLIQPLAGMFSRVSNDYGEGWNGYWSHVAVNGGALYPSTNTLVANNYPPLFFYVAGGLGRLIGDDIFAGRILALIGLAAVTVLIGRIVSLLGASRRWALISGIVFLAYAVADFHPYVAVANPQWPAQAIALSSVLFLLSDKPEALKTRSIVSAAALMVLGGLFKHNQFALPLAITIWLFVFNRRALVTWCLSGAILAGVATIAMHAAFGQAVFLELLGFSRTADWTNFFDGLLNIAGLGGLIAVAGLSYGPLRRDPRASLFLLFAAIGIVSGAGQRLGAGVYINAHFDALIGLTITCGTFLGLLASGAIPATRPWAAPKRLLLLSVAPLLLWSPDTIVSDMKRASDLAHQEMLWGDMIAETRTAPGPAFCELLSVCYWAGRPMGIDFFAYGQRLKRGADPRPLERLIVERKAAVLIIDRDKRYLRGNGRLPYPLPFLIERNYRVAISAKRTIALMIPRR